jgi:hypothetical protein
VNGEFNKHLTAYNKPECKYDDSKTGIVLTKKKTGPTKQLHQPSASLTQAIDKSMSRIK